MATKQTAIYKVSLFNGKTEELASTYFYARNKKAVYDYLLASEKYKDFVRYGKPVITAIGKNKNVLAEPVVEFSDSEKKRLANYYNSIIEQANQVAAEVEAETQEEENAKE